MVEEKICKCSIDGGKNFLYPRPLSKESIDKEQKRHDKAIKDMQRAQTEWAKIKKRQGTIRLYQ